MTVSLSVNTFAVCIFSSKFENQSNLAVICRFFFKPVHKPLKAFVAVKHFAEFIFRFYYDFIYTVIIRIGGGFADIFQFIIKLGKPAWSIFFSIGPSFNSYRHGRMRLQAYQEHFLHRRALNSTLLAVLH